MTSIYLDTSPLQNAHAGRGIGMYTKFLSQGLAKLTETITVCTNPSEKKKADVVHYPFFDLFFNTLPISIAQNTIVTIHDVIPLEFPDEYKPGIRGKIHFYRQKISLRFVKAIITDSHYSKQKIFELLKVPLDKIHVTYLAANPELQAQDEETIDKVRRQFKIPKKYILYVGDINYNKNIPQLIKALKFLPENITLVCVGKNFREQEIPEWQWITTQIEMSEVHDRVIFLSDVPNDQPESIAAVYSGALAYVQPSFSEGFGLPVLEAMKCETPVISSNRGSLPEVGGNVPVYVEPTAEAIAEAVEIVEAWSKEERNEAIKKGSEQARKFSWKKTAQETAEVYETVLALSQKKRA